MVTVDRRLWLTGGGELVEDGHPDAAFLWAAEGTEVPDVEAEKVGYRPVKARRVEDKQAAPPANKTSGLTVRRGKKD